MLRLQLPDQLHTRTVRHPNPEGRSSGLVYESVSLPHRHIAILCIDCLYRILPSLLLVLSVRLNSPSSPSYFLHSRFLCLVSPPTVALIQFK
jgi:hypothetical protein